MLPQFRSGPNSSAPSLAYSQPMKTSLVLDADLIRKAALLAGTKEKAALVRLGLEALIARESARRLAELGGTEKNLRAPRRRRTSKTA